MKSPALFEKRHFMPSMTVIYRRFRIPVFNFKVMIFITGTGKVKGYTHMKRNVDRNAVSWIQRFWQIEFYDVNIIRIILRCRQYAINMKIQTVDITFPVTG